MGFHKDPRINILSIELYMNEQFVLKCSKKVSSVNFLLRDYISRTFRVYSFLPLSAPELCTGSTYKRFLHQIAYVNEQKRYTALGGAHWYICSVSAAALVGTTSQFRYIAHIDIFHGIFFGILDIGNIGFLNENRILCMKNVEIFRLRRYFEHLFVLKSKTPYFFRLRRHYIIINLIKYSPPQAKKIYTPEYSDQAQWFPETTNAP